MKKEDKVLLHRKLTFLENFQGSKITSKKQARQLFDHVRQMIENEEITTMLGVESVVQYCIDNLKQGEKSVEKLAGEMKNFVS